MRIQFCGADRTVTGSCHLIEVAGKRILLDCGLYQGSRDLARRLNSTLLFDPKTIDAVILSHGHLDHCGKLPALTKGGYNGPIYCTAATADVARLILLDSADIQLEDVQYLNRRSVAPGQAAIEPLYSRHDVQDVLRSFRKVEYGQRTDLDGVSFTFSDAGHILGSAYVLLDWQEEGRKKTLLFTADVGRYNTPIIRDPAPLPGPVDLVLTESTYGNTQHAPMDEVGPQLLDAVKQVIATGSRLIVPSFAVGRTQTILWYMQRFVAEKQIPQIPIFVDSPMGVDASRIYALHRNMYDEETAELLGKKDLFGLAQATFASTGEQSKQINHQKGACVIIASSPTCEFGRVLHHLTISLERPNDLVTFVGFTPYNTLGRRLQDGQKRVRLYDRWYDVKCQIKTIHGLSAHADGDELLKFLKPTLVKETRAFVVHGEEDQAEAFASRLMHAGLGAANVPAMESSTLTAPADFKPVSRQPSRTDND
jgi:metallo-beta-lactamase family protein